MSQTTKEEFYQSFIEDGPCCENSDPELCKTCNQFLDAWDDKNYFDKDHEIKEIHFYSYKDVKYNNYKDTWDAIQRKENYIETSQMSLLSFDLQIHYGYDIYIHESEEDFYLVSCDERQCERTNKYLRPAHNLEKLWAAGEFNHE